MSPEEDRTRDTVDSEPKHYQLRTIPAPLGHLRNQPTTKFPKAEKDRNCILTCVTLNWQKHSDDSPDSQLWEYRVMDNQ